MPADTNTLRIRSRVLQAIRRFFIERDFIEVETPVRLKKPAMELHIDAEPSGDGYLRTSPELHMKRLLAKGHKRIFQMGPCFRHGEAGRFHKPEYTMLEWYRANANYLDVLVDTKALVTTVLKTVTQSTILPYGNNTIEIAPQWDCLTVTDAFIEYAGWNPVTDFDADRFDMDLVERVEPNLPRGRPVILKDYPAQLAALSRLNPDNPSVAERWELYIGGMEIANAFSELTDPAEQRSRFEDCARARAALGKQVYETDEDFMAALEKGIPPSGGVALGVDRLVMLAVNADSIDNVTAFSV